jgi:pyruvate/2-oxoglutarate dehydrogenase complex dihydrolipoamide acyltransferase (E2) component
VTPLASVAVKPRLETEISEVHFADGAEVKAGQPLYALESEKSVQEIEAPTSGTLKIMVSIGATYKVGTVLAEIL